MKKLKNKVFLTLLLILSFFLILIIVVHNHQLYVSEKNNINDRLVQINNFIEDLKKYNIDAMKENNQIFLNEAVYAFLLDKNNNIVTVITNNDVEKVDSKILKYVSKVITNKDYKAVGNLFLGKYAHLYLKDSQLILLDIAKTKSLLQETVQVSVFILLICEGLIVTICYLLTRWITMPAEESLDKQKEFIADASHELKTPLSVIMASSEALEKKYKKNNYVKVIQSETERMNSLIKNLLDLAKTEKSSKLYGENNISKIVEKMILTFESIMYEKQIDLEYNIDKNIILFSSKEDIEKLLSILLDNAIKHTQKGKKIRVSLHREKDKIILEVKNEGEPIPEGYEEKIFERFFRLDKARNRSEQRYGLGLAIAKNIVINHDGKITAASKDGETCFKVVLKAKK